MKASTHAMNSHAENDRMDRTDSHKVRRLALVCGTSPASDLGQAAPEFKPVEVATTLDRKASLLNTKEAAAMLRLQPQTLAKWRSSGDGRLPYLKSGRIVRYKTTDVLAMLLATAPVKVITERIDRGELHG